MAKFQKGQGGRPKGKPNKTTQLQRQFVQSLLDGRQSKIKSELSKLTGKDYLTVISGMMEFVIPKLQRTELDGKLSTNLDLENAIIKFR